MAELRPNNVKIKLNAGNVVAVPLGPLSGDLIEHFGPLGFDALWLEGEHGPVDFNNIPDLTRACDLWGISPIVRVHQNQPGVIYRTLDLGAQGIVVPHVDSKEEALAVVDAGKFAPLGHRGSFTSRQGIGVENYFDQANDYTTLIVLIEDIAAINNLDQILEVDHIDVFFVAPADLAQSMGYAGGGTMPEVEDVVAKAIRKISDAGRTPGTLTNQQSISKHVEMGVKFLGFSWLDWLKNGSDLFNNTLDRATSNL